MSAAGRAAFPPHARVPLALLLLAAAALLLPSLGLFPLFDVDEGAFSEATREMIEGGDWLSTTLNVLPRYDKPILIYWLQALSVQVFGLGEFSLRLPSALAGLCWVGMVARFGIERWGLRPGLFAGAVTATSLGVVAMARAATADALLNALLVATLLDLWHHLEAAQRGESGRAPLLRAYLWAGLGVLTKGPIAILIPAATALLFALTTGRWRQALRAGLHPAGWAVLAAVALPWYLAQWHVHGREFIDGFFVKHNLDRFGGPLEGHSGSVFYYVLVVPLLLLPWPALLAPVAAGTGRLWRESPAASRYLLCWFAFVLVFFSLSGTKLPHYALYGTTPLFLLAGRALAEEGRWSQGVTRAVIIGAALLCLLISAAPALALAWSVHAAGDARLAFYAAQASRAQLVAGTAFHAVSLACLGGCLLLAVLPRPGGALRAGAAALLLSVSVAYALSPWLGEMLSGPVRDAGRMAAKLGGPAVSWNIGAPSFSVYRGASTPARPPGPGELALTRTDRLAADADVEVLLHEGGVALVRQRPVQ
jgi:4-amino-4-deoxy-L-arabinose transferase-like glycosyltransferase